MAPHSEVVKTHKATYTEADKAEQMLLLTFLTVVKLVKLAGFTLALAKNQVVSDVAIGVIGRFPLEDDLGGRVG